tara:strand:+ start:170 stop:541 length:372 start_codon:yes stop_codon:yes gene_type:complete
MFGVPLVKPLVDLGGCHFFPVVTVEDPHHVGRGADAFDALLATEVQAVEFGPGGEIGGPLVSRQAEDLGFDPFAAVDRDTDSGRDDALPGRVEQERRGIEGFWMHPGLSGGGVVRIWRLPPVS